MDAITHAVRFPAPAGYEDSFAVPGDAAAPPKAAPSAMAIPGAPDMATAATSVVAAVKRVDYVPLGVGEIATMLMLVLVWRHLKGAGERMRALADGDAGTMGSWIPEDSMEERMAFEARYGRGSKR